MSQATREADGEKKRSVRRIVLKFGTGILTQPENSTIDLNQIERLSSEVSALVAQGYECVLVSSGAVGAGLMALGMNTRPDTLAGVQACAAVGQGRLMEMYGAAFGRRGLHVAQLLLTHSDLDSRTRCRNAKNTLEWLLSSGGVVPIINENDSVAVEELRVGDNDHLSAVVAGMLDADLLILLTTAPGLLKDDETVPEVYDLNAVISYAKPTKGKLSVGGMASKLEAVRMALDEGIPTVVASGRTPGILAAILQGGLIAGTRFYPPADRP